MQSSYVIILLEVIVVMIIARINVPGVWAAKFTTAFFGSIPAMAIKGLIVWLIYFALLGLSIGDLFSSLAIEVAEDLDFLPIGMSVVRAFGFIAQHPIFALAFGPLVCIWFWRSLVSAEDWY